MVCFLHVADLHLGMRITRFSPEAIGRIREARFQALQQVRDHVREKESGIAFVIVAGDLFDDVHVLTDFARRVYQFLESFPVPVLVLPGNHDPLQAGSVWDIDPWKQAGGSDMRVVRVLRDRMPFDVLPGVTIFPCPVYRKTSTENPTEWIRDHPRTPACGIRIGIAHGSVMDRPNLPDDDHPIAITAPGDLQLDYLALGHWHNAREFRDSAGQPRMAYPGVHEPMRFQEDTQATGWKPYSSGGMRDEFLDVGPGTAYSVTISAPGADVALKTVRVGYYNWACRTEILNSSDDLGTLINEISEAQNKERTLLRLKLRGTLPIAALPEVDDLRSVLSSYVVGELDDRELMIEPTEQEVQTAIGSGVLATVFDRLREQATANDSDPNDSKQGAVARRAIQLMYRLSRS